MTDLPPNVPLHDFIDTFYGYGSFQGRFWFIGMEEGGGNTLAEIARRIRLWDARGRHDLEHLAAYHRELGETEFFDQPVTSQATWRQLIRVVLTAQKQSATLDDINHYQRERLGQWGQETALIDLMPLPSPSITHWLYSAWDVPHLHTREAYVQFYAPRRVAHIRQKIAVHRPSAVIFYGLGLRGWWTQIADLDFAPQSRFFTGADAHTRYVMAPHPVTPGIGNRDYQEIGAWLRDHVS